MFANQQWYGSQPLQVWCLNCVYGLQHSSYSTVLYQRGSGVRLHVSISSCVLSSYNMYVAVLSLDDVPTALICLYFRSYRSSLFSLPKIPCKPTHTATL